MMEVFRHPRNRTINRMIIENNRVRFDIELRGFVTVFEGDSSTGKTFLFNTIRVEYGALNKSEKVQTGISEVLLFNDILASAETVLSNIKNKEKALIMIDAASSILSGREEILNYILKDRKNQYIIAARGGVYINLNFMCELYEDLSDSKPRIINKFLMTKPTRK